jgi:hypothetical protein
MIGESHPAEGGIFGWSTRRFFGVLQRLGHIKLYRLHGGQAPGSLVYDPRSNQ